MTSRATSTSPGSRPTRNEICVLKDSDATYCAKASMFNIKNLVQGYHMSARSVAELVPWMALWDSQTVLNIDASALAIYEYSGFEGQGRSFMENDSLVGRYERAFRA